MNFLILQKFPKGPRTLLYDQKKMFSMVIYINTLGEVTTKASSPVPHSSFGAAKVKN